MHVGALSRIPEDLCWGKGGGIRIPKQRLGRREAIKSPLELERTTTKPGQSKLSNQT